MPSGALEIVYGCADQVAGGLDVVYWCAPLVEGSLELVYGGGRQVAGSLELVYGSTVPVAGALEISYRCSAGAVDGSLELVYHAPATDPVEGSLEICYSCADLGGRHADHSATGLVTVEGEPLGYSRLTLDNALAWLECTLTVHTEAEFARCSQGAILTVAAGGELFRLLIEEATRTVAHGATAYQVTALSQAAWLDAPYADTLSGELTGMAATIAAGLAGTVPIAWQTVDWHIPPDTWYAADQTPLELLRVLAAAAGAELQSLPDGTLLVAPLYPLSLPAWDEATVAATMVDRIHLAQIDADFEYRPGYNRFLLTDRLTATASLRLEEEQLTETSRLVRGYQVPWDGAFTLRHTGGSWVTVEPLGVLERTEVETVEFIAGAGTTAYPVYSLDSAVWLQQDLGTVTPWEDGTLAATGEGESLATIIYTTRCRAWLVRDQRAEQVQVVLEQ